VVVAVGLGVAILAIAGPARLGPSRAVGALPGVNGSIAFVSDRVPSQGYEVFVVPAAGGAPVQLSNSTAADSGPTWTPGGTDLVFVSTRANGSDDIFRMGADGSAPTPLTNTPGVGDANPSVSPDGSMIVFVSDRDGNLEIYVMKSDGSGQTRLAADPAPDTKPSWSPDGTKIVFMSKRMLEDDWELFTMNADGTGVTRITNRAACSNSEPDWSPDGTKIALRTTCLDAAGDAEIGVVSAGGGPIHRLTDNDVIDSQPAWSPDGTKVAFLSNEDGDNDIWIMNAADGTGRTKLADSPASDFSPSWQPLPSPAGPPAPPPPPPPAPGAAPVSITRAVLLAPRWQASTISAKVRIEGTLPAAASLRIRLVKGRSAASAPRGLSAGCRLGVTVCTVAAPAGPLAVTLQLAPTTAPGRYQVEVSGTTGGAAFAPVRAALVVPAPDEGVVDRAWVSTTANGAELATVPSSAAHFFVNFRFAALPRRPLLTLVVRYPDGTTAIARDRYRAPPRRVPVRQPKPPGGRHAVGTWRFTLKAGERVIRTVRVKIVP
jgi:Tol biopolymer transport system component